MPKSSSEKCRLCAKLSTEDAIALHGPSGTNCWVGEPCHKRRTYYRNRDRYNSDKRRAYRQSTGQELTVLTIAPPAVFSAELHLYRARMDAPLHGIGAELRKGDVVVAKIEPVHAQGLSAAQVKGFLKEVLSAFSEQADESLGKFRCATGALARSLSDLWSQSMTAVQLQLNLWQRLEQAQAQPEATDWRQLCLAFDEAIDLTPLELRLATAADAIEQMADLLLARATAWAEDWNRRPGDGPVLDEDLFAELVRQSFSLDLSGLVDEPELYMRAASEKVHDDAESVVEYREKAEVLAELESFVSEGAADDAELLEHDEDIAAWAEVIRRWLELRGMESAAIWLLQDETGLSLVKLWLAALLCGLGMEQRDGFYDVEGVAIWLR